MLDIINNAKPPPLSQGMEVEEELVAIDIVGADGSVVLPIHCSLSKRRKNER